MTRPATRPREAGMILIAVLLAVAIMAVMVVATAALTRSGVGNEELEQRRLASHLALRSGIEAAKALILATPEQDRLFLHGAPRPIALGEGLSANLAIRDAAGLVDLNRSDPKLIAAVARAAGLGDDVVDGLADKIAALRKAATPPRPALPAKVPQPAAAPSPTGAAKLLPGGAKEEGAAPPPVIFLSVEQMPALLDISTDDAMALNDVLTVYNPTGEINPLAAPDEVLEAIPGISEADISYIADTRKAGPGASLNRLRDITLRVPGTLTMKAPTVFMLDLTLAEGGRVLPGSTARAVLRLLPQGPAAFGTLALEEN